MRIRDTGKYVYLAVLLLLLLEVVRLAPVRGRVLLAIYGLALALVLAMRLRFLRESGLLKRVAVALALHGLYVLVATTIDPNSFLIDELLPTVSGWCAALVILPEFSRTSDEASPAFGARHLVALVAISFIVLTIVHQLAVGRFAIISDEATYLTQARWMAPGRLTWEIDPAIARFFLMRKIDYLNGHLYGMYPPGWPALLALFRMGGLEWWSNVILATASVAMMWFIGKRIGGPYVGAIAALLLATSQYFLFFHAGYMSHGATMAGFLGGTWLLVSAAPAHGWKRVVRWVIAGALFTYVVTVRPLTGLTLGASITGWVVLRQWRQERTLALRMISWMAVGAVVPAILFVAHNEAVFGVPMAFGYQVMHPGSYDLGFGQRGFRTLDAQANWEQFSFAFTPRQALGTLLVQLSRMNTSFAPIGLLVPLIVVAVSAGHRPSWRVLGIFAVLPFTYFFYWGSGQPRMYAELLPFMMLGVATMLYATHQRRPAIARAFLVLLVASQAIVALPWPPGSTSAHRPWAVGFDHVYGRGNPGRWATLYAADSLARANGRVLFFTHEGSRFDNLMDRLYPFNGDRFNGRILVARDLGDQNALLMARFPDRVAYLVEDRGRDVPSTFTLIDRSRLAP